MRTLFHKTLQVEQNVELLKSELHKRPDFDLTQAFEVINRTNKAANENYISIHEFKEMLATHGVYTLDRDIKSLFNRYDKDGDGKINFKDFANEMVTVKQYDDIKSQCIFPHRQFDRAQMGGFPFK